MPAWPAAAVSTFPAELTLHLLWVPSGCRRERTSKLQEQPAHSDCGVVRTPGFKGLGVGVLARGEASSGAGMTGLVCAGGSELSDAMSEGERPDEASSLHPENEDHGMEPALISPAYVCCCPVKAYMPCDICLWYDFYIRPRTWIQMLSQSISVQCTVSQYRHVCAEGYARQASSAAMAATAKAVAKLKLQQGQEQDPGPASTGLPASSHACNGNGTTSSLATADSETEAEAPGPVLLNPADSGYFADTEDGLALKRPPGPAPGHRSSSLRPRSRQ